MKTIAYLSRRGRIVFNVVNDEWIHKLKSREKMLVNASNI